MTGPVRHSPPARWLLRATALAPILTCLLAVPDVPGDQLVISEFMAVNDNTLEDDSGVASDWVEIYNAGSNTVQLAGWHLTDSTNALTKWTFPSLSLEANRFLLVYASGLDRTNPAAPLHANFKLSGNGEYLALVEPDGTTVAHGFAPAFPQQYPDISYGLSMPRYTRLLGHWTFDDASTTTALLTDTSPDGDDKSGTFLSGTPPNGAAGVIGGAVELSGYQNISLGSSPEFDRTTWTVSMWLYSDPGVTGWRTAFGCWNAGGGSAMHIGRDFSGAWGDHGGGQTSGGSVQNSVWTHIASVRTPEGMENSLWVDGVKQAQVSSGAPGVPDTANVYLGTKNGTDNPWNGRIDDAGYFDDTLTPGEIIAIQVMAHAPFDYDLAAMQQLFALHRAGNGSVTVKGDVWGYTGGLGSKPGISTAGNVTNLVLDGWAGTGVQYGLEGPPPSIGDGISTNARAFFTQPSPGYANGTGQPDAGPIVSDVTGNHSAVSDGSSIVVTARVAETAYPLAQVTLHYRVMYAAEVATLMRDDGSVPDAVAGDGVFSAAIPPTASGPGEMVRWCVTATDTRLHDTRRPRFSGTSVAPEYYGTVVADTTVSSALPILQWFVEDPVAATEESGTRACVYYEGEFYDNVFVRRRGQTSANWPKKSYKFEFNEGHHFRFDALIPRVDEFDLNTTYTDKSYVRTVLAYEAYRDAGSAACESFPLRVQQNGSFFSVAIFLEQPDRDYLRRNERDPDGALYKVVQNSIWGIPAYRGAANSGVEKKTRHHEGFSDLQSLIDGMGLTGTDLENYLFDNINLSACMSYMAASIVVQNIDRTLKNFFLYRDTEGDREWEFLPWDVDLSFGPNALNTDAVVAAEDTGNGSSHPFMGTRAHPYAGLWNGLLDAILTTPSTREMFLRRLRTVMDKQLGTPRFEARVDELVSLLASDVLLDKAAWGANAHFGAVDYSLPAAAARIKSEYLEPRRTHLFSTHVSGGVGIPSAQNGYPMLTFGALEYNPPSGNQDEEYIELINANAVAVDISGWTLEGGVEHRFEPGTVIRAGGSLYLTPDAVAFRARATSPRGAEGLFVQGAYRGHLSSFGETLCIRAPDMSLVAETRYEGVPSDQQRYLRISELHHSPAGGGRFPAGAYEFIEIVNTHPAQPLDLTGVVLTGGVTFTFSPGETLGPGDRVVITADRAAFAERYDTSGISIAGTFAGTLNNDGETVKLDDRTGSTIHQVSYGIGRKWPVTANGAGHSLVLRDNAYVSGHRIRDAGTFWRASTYLHGSPGRADPLLHPTVVLNEFAAHTDTTVPGYESNDWIELFNFGSNPVSLAHWYLSDDPENLTNWAIPTSRILTNGGWIAFDEINDFHNPANSGFGLNKDGEALLLSYLPGDTRDRVADAVVFDGQENGRTQGRYPDGTGSWRAMWPSRRASNTNPPGDVLISEVMFSPWRYASPLMEYIVLHNPTDTTVIFRNASGNWRIHGDVRYTFVGRAAIVSGGYLVLVPFDPSDPDLKSEFIAAYGLTGQSIIMVGPYEGRLSNSDGWIRLQRPQAPDVFGEPVSWVTVDELHYSAYAPWFDSADGTGLALHRISASTPGLDPASWQTGQPALLTDNVQWPTTTLTIAPGTAGVEVGWAAAPGFSYELQRSPSLFPASWKTLQVVATNGRVRLAVSLEGKNEYYRVRQRE